MAIDTSQSSLQGKRAALLGFAAGLRSQVPLAHLVYAADRDELSLGQDALDRWLRHPRAVQLFTVSAIGEMIGDKLPFVPPRTEPAPLFGRLMFGAAAGAIGGRSLGGSFATGATAGAVAAAMTAIVGTTLRQNLPRITGLPSIAIALAEDTISHLLARRALSTH